ncbi:MAG: hypothetical protein HY903_15990 [Deltaproteobacteria bacterium]|nr:hypothetical protein [Deltaproteobacteria bacterium]
MRRARGDGMRRRRRSRVAAAGLLGLAAIACAAVSGGPGIDVGDVTYTEDLQPIFLDKCGACHAGRGDGDTHFAVAYADMLRDSRRCPGQLEYQCALTLVEQGLMPRDAGCTGAVGVDETISACLGRGARDLLLIWVNEGAPE